MSCLAIEAEMEQTTDEIKRLQGCINDLISIQALPAIWSGQESSQIIGTLLDVLVRILVLDFAYAWLSTSMHGSPIEMIRLAQRRTPEVQAAEVGRAFAGWLTDDPPTPPFVAPNPIGEGNVSMAPFRLGLQDDGDAVHVGHDQASSRYPRAIIDGSRSGDHDGNAAETPYPRRISRAT